MATQADQSILVERVGAVATVVLNDPPYNALGLATVDTLERLIPTLAADASVRAIVITGAGTRGFSVGANIKEFGQGVAAMTLEGFLGQRLAVLAAIEQLEKPVVCAIEGACIGGGLELALCCHFRLASEDARIGLPEIDLGIMPAWGGTQRLTHVVGRAHALDLMLRGKRINGAEAERIGLIHSVHPAGTVRQHAETLAAELAEQAPLAVAAILRAVVQGAPRPLAEGLAIELGGILAVSGSEDSREGITAFLEKRKPVFRGR